MSTFDGELSSGCRIEIEGKEIDLWIEVRLVGLHVEGGLLQFHFGRRQRLIVFKCLTDAFVQCERLGKAIDS